MVRTEAEGFPNGQGNPWDSLSAGNRPVYESHPRFRYLRRLGRGSFGDVDEVQEVSTREVYARKTILAGSNNLAATAREDEVRNEVRVMQDLTHQHIARVLFWTIEQDTFNILMKPVGDYDLRCFLESYTNDGYHKDTLPKILPWFGCLLDALAFAHKKNVVHRDIKPSNILIKDFQVYLADFGSAKAFALQETSRTSNPYVCGTPVYYAPETKADNPPGRQADVFSLGCVLSEILTVCSGRSLDAYQSWRKVSNEECANYAFRANLPRVTAWIQQLKEDCDYSWHDGLVFNILCMLHKEPDRRSSAQDGVTLLMNLRQDMLICPHH